MRENKELLIVIPAYNEEKNIQRVLDQLERNEIAQIGDILIMNDASRDSTERLVSQRGYRQIVNRSRLGYGNTLQEGYRYALRKGYEFVIQMDADAQHDACNIRPIYQRLRETDADGRCPDIVMGSRFMRGSFDFPVSALKRAAYAWFRFLIRLITGRRIADPTTGLQGLDRRAFSYYSQDGHYDKYPDANMVIQMLLLGFRLAEIPAVMHARTDGKSMHHGWNAVWYMVRMLWSIIKIVFRIRVLKRV